MTKDEQEAFVRQLRHIRYDLCQQCEGSGTQLYPSTATWRGGIGGAAMTYDVCDKCWGSGEQERPWTDLRKLEAERDALIERRAATYFEDHLGVRFNSCRTALLAICDVLDKLSNKRKPPVGTDYFEVRAWQDSTVRLSKLIRGLIEKAPTS